MRRAAALVSLAAMVLAGCGAPPPLPAKSAVVPAGIDLSGDWELRPDDRDTNRRIVDTERRVAGGGESLIPGKNSSSRHDDDMQVHVFLETGALLRITQTDYALFVSFDRAIVEEYRFGEQRKVSVGPIEADRVSGWENGAYVVVTRGKEGAMLIESYRLQGADSMIRKIRIEDGDSTELDVEQVFDRSRR